MSQLEQKINSGTFEEVSLYIREKMQRQGRTEYRAPEVIALEIAYRRMLIARDGCCSKCQFPGALTLDHIIPLALLFELGFPRELFFDVENFQLLCRRCNMYKSRRLDFTNPKTKVLLFKYIDTVPDIRVIRPPVYEHSEPTQLALGTEAGLDF